MYEAIDVLFCTMMYLSQPTKITLKLEAAISSETLPVYRHTWRHPKINSAGMHTARFSGMWVLIYQSARRRIVVRRAYFVVG
jgi:hypothetical protein